MYKSIDGVAETAISVAVGPGGAVTSDRRRFVPFFEAAERYISSHGLIVGGKTATLLLLNHPLDPENFFYELYSSNALDDARALTGIFYELDPEGLGHYANMVTGVPRKEFSINVNERTLFRVKALEIHRGAHAADIIVPSTRPAFFARGPAGEPLTMRCMGPEIQLIEIYTALTNPARAGEWAALLRVEESLRNMFAGEVRDKIKEVGGGGGAATESSTSDLIAVLTKEYSPRSGHVVVGAHAIRASGARRQARIQIVTSNTFAEEERVVQRIASRLGFNVQSTSNDPKVPSDDRLRRMTMYIIRPGARREPFLDVYNSGEYELVPFVGGGASGQDAGVGGGVTPPGTVAGGKSRPRVSGTRVSGTRVSGTKVSGTGHGLSCRREPPS